MTATRPLSDDRRHINNSVHRAIYFGSESFVVIRRLMRSGEAEVKGPKAVN